MKGMKIQFSLVIHNRKDQMLSWCKPVMSI